MAISTPCSSTAVLSTRWRVVIGLFTAPFIYATLDSLTINDVRLITTAGGRASFLRLGTSVAPTPGPSTTSPPPTVFWGRVGFLGFSHPYGEFGENFFSLGAPWGAAFKGDPPHLLLQPRSRPSFPFWRGLPPVFWGSQAKDLKPTRGLAWRGDKIQLLANAGCFGGFRN